MSVQDFLNLSLKPLYAVVCHIGKTEDLEITISFETLKVHTVHWIDTRYRPYESVGCIGYTHQNKLSKPLSAWFEASTAAELEGNLIAEDSHLAGNYITIVICFAEM